jgi:hypothetical protein
MGNQLRFIGSLIASTAIGMTAAFAHHPGIGGIGGGGGVTTIGAGTLDQGQFAASAFIEYVRLNQLSNATLLANIGNDVHGLQSIESKVLAFAYGFTNDFMVSVRVPWVRRTGILEGVQDDPADPATINNRGSTSGFGDVIMLGQYRFFNNQASGTQVAALFGFKAPTGITNLVDPFGERYEAEFQPGSGSWDGLFGAAFSQRLSPSWGFHANVLGVLTGTGTQDTNLGNRLLYNAAVVYRVFGETANEPHSHDAPAAYAHAGSHPGMVTKAKPPARSHRTPMSRSTPCSNSTANGMTCSAPLVSPIRIRAATRFFSRRACGSPSRIIPATSRSAFPSSKTSMGYSQPQPGACWAAFPPRSDLDPLKPWLGRPT